MWGITFNKCIYLFFVLRWVAYSHVDFSGNQYVLEKGFYTGCGDWGSGDNRICSIQPILPVSRLRDPIHDCDNVFMVHMVLFVMFVSAGVYYELYCLGLLIK